MTSSNENKAVTEQLPAPDSCPAAAAVSEQLGNEGDSCRSRSSRRHGSPQVTALQRLAIQVLSKSSDSRGKQEIDQIIPWLKKKFEILAQLENDVVQKLVSCCECERVRHDTVVIKQGDVGHRYYMLLSGSVSVYVKPDTLDLITDKSDDNIKQGQNKVKQQPVVSVDAMSQGDENEKMKPVNKKQKQSKTQDRKQFGSFAVRYGEGECFGEVALLRDNTLRMATVIANCTGHLIAINRHLFNAILRSLLETEYTQRRELVDSHSLFRSWSRRNRESLELALQKRTFSFDSYIMRQGEAWKGLMFVTGGTASVQVEPSKHRTQYAQMLPFTDKEDVYYMELNRQATVCERNTPRDSGPLTSRSENRVHIRRTEGYAGAERRVHNRYVDLCSIEKGDILGDIETAMCLDTYTCHVKAISQVHAFLVSPDNVERLMSRESGVEPMTCDKLRDLAVSKLSSRTQSVQGCDIPLYRHLLHLAEQAGRRPYQRPVPHVSTSVPGEQEEFQHLLCRYMEDKAALVTPRVAGGIYYKDLAQRQSEKRSQMTAPPHSRAPSQMTTINKATARIKKRRRRSAAPRNKTVLKKLMVEASREIEQVAKREYIQSYREAQEIQMQEVRRALERSASQQLTKESDLLTATNKASDSIGQTPLSVVAAEACLTGASADLHPRGPQSAVASKPSSPTKRPQTTFITKLTEGETEGETEEEPGKHKLVLNATSTHPAARTDCVLPSLSSIAQLTAQAPHMINRLIHTHRSCELPLISQTNKSGVPTRLVSRSCSVLETARRSLHLHPEDMSYHRNTPALHRKVLPLLAENPKYRDCETNNTSLAYLEARVGDFLRAQGRVKPLTSPEGDKARPRTLPTLNRFESNDELSRQPLPGGHVMVKMTPCPLTQRTDLLQSSHRHVRSQLIDRVEGYDKLVVNRLIRQMAEQKERSDWLEERGEKQRSEQRLHRNSAYVTK